MLFENSVQENSAAVTIRTIALVRVRSLESCPKRILRAACSYVPN
jgi:hypothetical protein